jgi:predicted Zn finger-like uncharacterized protein/prepilin-type processing-associated H-X9-DG protein
MNIQCPHCGQSYQLTPEQVPQYSGQTITCTACNKAFTVPRLTQPPVPPGLPAGYPPGVPQQVSYATPQAQATNGLAVASLVTGILGLFAPLVGIVGIVLGIMGLRKTRDPSIGGQGMAIAGIVTGSLGIILSICMISIMVSILFPSLTRARETANRVKCASNMRQIGLAAIMYANEHGGPLPDDLAVLFANEDLGPSTLNCPSVEHDQMGAANLEGEQLAAWVNENTDYIYVGRGLDVNGPAETAVLYEPAEDHGDGGGNVLFLDGHVEWTDANNLKELLASQPAATAPALERP